MEWILLRLVVEMIGVGIGLFVFASIIVVAFQSKEDSLFGDIVYPWEKEERKKAKEEARRLREKKWWES